jgi:large subunit ribosomal protein L9
MRLLLLSDVKNVGKKGEILEVADGYARNFLLPKKLASPATDATVKSKAKEQAEQVAKKARELEAARADAKEFSAQEVIVKAKVGEGGILFGSITSQDIVHAIKAQFGREVDKRKVQISEPIRGLGEFKVPVKLYPEVTAELSVKVIAE